ncbi:unnamed protein product [Lampetra fluviatilis]
MCGVAEKPVAMAMHVDTDMDTDVDMDVDTDEDIDTDVDIDTDEDINTEVDIDTNVDIDTDVDTEVDTEVDTGALVKTTQWDEVVVFPEAGMFCSNKGEHLAYRYEVLARLGVGSYGQVFRCIDHKSKEEVAIKMLRHESCINKKRQQLELEIMKILQSKGDPDNNNIVTLLDYFTFRGHNCVVLELISGDFLQKLDETYGLYMTEMKPYVRSILQALAKLKAMHIIHADLKPANILVKDHISGNIRLTDFGLSISEICPRAWCLGTRWYMPPEMYFGLLVTCSADMWSLGCVVAEMLFGKLLFKKSLEDHIGYLIQMLGLPPKAMIDASIHNIISFDEKNRPIVNGKRIVPCSVSLKTVLGTRNRKLINFLRGCLQWDPQRRLTPTEALNHPFLRGGRAKPPQANFPPCPATDTEPVAACSLSAAPRLSQADCQVPAASKQTPESAWSYQNTAGSVSGRKWASNSDWGMESEWGVELVGDCAVTRLTEKLFNQCDSTNDVIGEEEIEPMEACILPAIPYLSQGVCQVTAASEQTPEPTWTNQNTAGLVAGSEWASNSEWGVESVGDCAVTRLSAKFPNQSGGTNDGIAEEEMESATRQE